LINNGGGGIFRILPGHRNHCFNTYFETSHCLTAQHLAKMYGLDYITASDNASLELFDNYVCSK
jgi:2-succinyl-5-enolpyruvyl-6-hydroxy-3-cyclohexene-1-carboxylate synthase